MGLLDGRNAIVTGSARGLGLAMAERFGTEGARVVLSDIDAAALKEAERKLAADGLEVTAVPADVTDEDAVATLVRHCADRWGSVDVMVNNAGITRDGVLRKMSTEDFRRVIEVHMLGGWLGTKMASLQMREQGTGGSVINISSMSGKVGNAGQTNYSAAKAGVESMGVVWAKELARYGIRVGSVAPGFTHTEILASMRPEVLDKLTAPVPLKRLGQPEEIAHAVLFIFENDFFTGRCLEVDGGLRF